MKHYKSPLLLLSCFFALAAPVFPAGFTISSNSSTAQTLSSGTGSVNAGITLSVSGNADAVLVTGNSSIVNLGSIIQTQDAGTSSRGIRLNTNNVTLTVTNGSTTNSAALVQAEDADAIQVNKANDSITLTNYGTFNSINHNAGGAQAIDFNAITTGSNTIFNFSTGFLTASEADAVRPGVSGFVNNDGTIKSTTALGNGSDGIDAQTNTGITVVNAYSAGSGIGTGLIEGGRHGITGGNTTTGVYAMSITNNLGGTIQGDNGSGLNIDGINGLETVTIVNHGTITGNGHDIGDGLGHDGDGVDVDGLVNLTNTGLIKSINAFGVGGIEFSEGVTVGGGTINNSGTIEGSVASGNTTAIGRGITIAGVDKDSLGNSIPVQAPYAATTITNSGLIKGDSDSGILFSSALASGFSHTIINQAAGTIQTGSTTAPAILLAADNTEIDNSGTIDGSSSGKAIAGGAGSITLKILSGTASILGDITGGGGTNSLVIDPGAGNSFSYAGSITNFHAAQIKSGTFNLSGALTADATTVSSGGTLAGTGTLAGLVSVTTGGTISPGNSPGKLTLQTGLDLSGGGKYLWQLGSLTDDSSGTGGTDFDQLSLTGGNLALGGTSLLTLDFSFLGSGDPNSANAFWQSDHSWTIITGSGATDTGGTNFSQITDAVFTDGSFTTTTDPSGDAVLHFRAVPEPTSATLLLVSIASSVGMVRCRRAARIVRG